MPKIRGQNQPPHLVSERPPIIPKSSDILARGFRKNPKIRCIEESRRPEENGFRRAILFAKKPERQSLGEKSERQFVLSVTECPCNLLEKRFVASMIFKNVAKSRCFALEPE